MNRPYWIDDPSIFPPWQAKYLRKLAKVGVLTYSTCVGGFGGSGAQTVPLSLRRLAEQGYVSITRKRPLIGPGWREVRLTVAGHHVLRPDPYRAAPKPAHKGAKPAHRKAR